MIERLRPDRLPNREPMWFAADALLALLFGYMTIESLRTEASVAEYGAVVGFGWVLVLGPTALILIRRAAPATALAAATVLYLLAAIDHGEGNSILAAPCLAYTLALTRPPRIAGAMVLPSAILVSSTALYGPGDLFPIGVLISMMLFAIGTVAGMRVRHSQIQAEVLAAEADAARIESAVVAERAVADERARLARELHDAVGHAVNVMVMQAGAARMVATEDRTVGSLREIERVGRSALADLDRMLGLLRGDADERAPLEPAHGLADIAGLVAGVRATGTDVVLRDHCAGAIDGSVERPIGAAAYRIVQEALTNAVKHAGPAQVEVSLSCDDDELVVTVTDDGRGAAAAPTRNGRGIIGMRERASVLGGRLDAGPRSGGGYRVGAHLPRVKEHR